MTRSYIFIILLFLSIPVATLAPQGEKSSDSNMGVQEHITKVVSARERLIQSIATIEAVHNAAGQKGEVLRCHLWQLGDSLPWRSTLQPSCMRQWGRELKQQPKAWPVTADAPALRVLLEDHNPKIRSLAAEALATLHKPEDVERLSKLLIDNSVAIFDLQAKSIAACAQSPQQYAGGAGSNATVSYTWQTTTVANHAAWGLRLMLGDCCPEFSLVTPGCTTTHEDAFNTIRNLSSGTPVDHLWYWQEYIHRALHEIIDNSESVVRARTPGFNKLDLDLRYKLVNDERRLARRRWLNTFVDSMHAWPAERRAMVRLLATWPHQGGADMAYADSPDELLFCGSMNLGLKKDRIRELMAGVNLWPETYMRGDRGGESQIVERLAMGWRECFDATDVPFLLGRFSNGGDVWWSGRAALLLALANLIPSNGKASDDAGTAEGFLRRTLKEDRDAVIRAYAAQELMRIGLDVHWPLIMDRFFADNENGDYFRKHILEGFLKNPVSEGVPIKLVELVCDERYRSLWLARERPGGKIMVGGECRNVAAMVINAKASKTIITYSDLKSLEDAEKGSECLKVILAKVRSLEKY